MYHICAIIKDEHLFLREWIEYHIALGFDHITLYEDFTSKSHKQTLSPTLPHNGEGEEKNVFYDGRVTLLSMRDVPECKEGKTGRQIACYHDFIKNSSPFKGEDGRGSSWCAFIDIDEFFRLDEGWTLDRLTETYKGTAGLCLWWQCYGANGHVKRPMNADGTSPVQESYSADPIPYNGYWQFKSFVNLSTAKDLLPPGGGREVASFINCHYHRFISHLDGTRADFRQDRNKRHIQLSPAHIDHYITKSWEDWEARLKRGNITKGIRDEEFFFELNPGMRGIVHNS